MSFQVYTPEQIPSHIGECELFMDFRPTVTVLASTGGVLPEFILVQSVKETDGVWWPVQGGIDGRSPQLAAASELEEEVELRVFPEQIKVLGGIDYPTGSRDGFNKGKLLIGFL